MAAAVATDLANAAKTAPDREAQLAALTQLHDLLVKKVRGNGQGQGRIRERTSCRTRFSALKTDRAEERKGEERRRGERGEGIGERA